MNAPIVLFAFNRLEAVARTVESLKQNTEAEESELYVYVDGPRKNVVEDVEKVLAVQGFVSAITGFKNVHCRFSTENKGLGSSLISGITEVIEQYGRAIVVEDDLYCSKNFLSYMNQALDFYESNKDVFSVCAYTNRVNRPRNYEYDVYSCVRSSSWGWGTWKDRWCTVDWQLEQWDECERNARDFNKWGGSDCYGMLRDWHDGKNHSWAIRFCYSQFVQNKVSIFPMISKVANEGFDGQGTNCKGWSRFKYDFDDSECKDFSFVMETLPNKSLLKDALSYHSILKRVYSRIMYMIYR